MKSYGSFHNKVHNKVLVDGPVRSRERHSLLGAEAISDVPKVQQAINKRSGAPVDNMLGSSYNGYLLGCPYAGRPCQRDESYAGKERRMAIRLGRFEMPKRLIKDAASTTTYGHYTVEPFEEGYARALGNSLRRVLLSSIESAAIADVKIEGVLHEFSTIPGSVEDVTEIITNLGGVRINLFTRESRTLRLDVSGPAEVTAGDIISDAPVEILNPDHHIATLDRDGRFKAELFVRVGRGYCPAEGNKRAGDQVIGVIPVDSLFSPVCRVKYSVEPVRVADRSNYEKLILEIWTDGRISASEALTHAAVILNHHLTVFVNYDKDLVEFGIAEQQEDKRKTELRLKLATCMNEIELGVRSSNCLNNANILTIGELVRKTESELLTYRNFGRTSLAEIKEKLAEMGLKLGMTLDEDLLKELP